MHLPAHPLWFWLILFSPCLIWVVLWAIASCAQVSLKPLTPWLMAGMVLPIVPYILAETSGNHKLLSLASESMFYSCMVGTTVINRRAIFETFRAPSKWYLPWSGVRFSIPQNVRIQVQDINSIAPWYVEKLGLHDVPNPLREVGAQTYKFNEDGKCVTLTTKPLLGVDRKLILFTKKMTKMREILSKRGIYVGPFERDRQGTRYFEIHDPEGNSIEVVEES